MYTISYGHDNDDDDYDDSEVFYLPLTMDHGPVQAHTNINENIYIYMVMYT